MTTARRALSVLLVGAGLVTLGWQAPAAVAAAGAVVAIGWSVVGLLLRAVDDPEMKGNPYSSYSQWRVDHPWVYGPFWLLLLGLYHLLVAPWLTRDDNDAPRGF